MHLATDVGGTFTDFVILDHGQLITFKLPSTPTAPQRTVGLGLERAMIHEGVRPLATLSHASTVATNSLLERKGARVAFIATAGFGDMLHIGRQDRPGLYDIDARRPAPLAERGMCFEVPERIGPGGEVIRPMEWEAAQDVVRQAREAGAEALAVCLLHSYADPVHELVLEKAAAEAALPCSLSSRVWPEFREFERASTTTMDAFLRPVIHEYLKALSQALADHSNAAVLRIMNSSGAMVPIHGTGVGLNPVDMLLSGPAGGVAASSYIARLTGMGDLVTLDMGGTSTDVALLLDGRPQLVTQGNVAGLPVRLPRVAIETVGAGGGSLARVGPGGLLEVGPESAGAEPGPASYGRGGVDFTVTDALLLAGWLPAIELPGDIALRPDLASRAAGPLASGLGLAIEELAMGVIEVAMAAMLRPLETLTLRQGHDPRNLGLLAFGGAGPLIACYVASRLGCPRVIVPARAGMFSALGLALSPVRFHRSLALMIDAKGSGPILERVREKLVDITTGDVEDTGLDPAQGRWDWAIDCRYTGQSHELAIPLTDPLDPVTIVKAFSRSHEQTNGYAYPDQPVELVALRCSLTFPVDEVSLPELADDGRREHIPADTGKVWWNRQWLEAPQYQREGLESGFTVAGPALLMENGSTTFVAPGWSGRIDRWSDLLLEAV